MFTYSTRAISIEFPRIYGNIQSILDLTISIENKLKEREKERERERKREREMKTRPYLIRSGGRRRRRSAQSLLESSRARRLLAPSPSPSSSPSSLVHDWGLLSLDTFPSYQHFALHRLLS
ncbi:uncharacterized protein ASPGLDRAFT_1366988 [Aspergillus glaucus CBS 516.65]|uniref:Uncharacterized protein n=1 Tax=Aspergillus glaucus CBS 516.65 TaxID=1160497 RepID=A0A1L9VNS8_ASPGL|nr:hypothetical protein ASPGLDRAFT_1366988 [Aspergillus glaucus CBS 516.65]OJJ85578.1 hypothetical protein ASPGLDRAFT_1366988 [Aspergillus glaucus CBS 516.65]